MKISRYVEMMEFPTEWISMDMLPRRFVRQQIDSYSAGDEESAEHDRNGAFHWWLKQNPEKEVLLKLFKLSLVDPDQIMAADVRRYIAKSKHADSEIIGLIEDTV